jgi:hypothetical protein
MKNFKINIRTKIIQESKAKSLPTVISPFLSLDQEFSVHLLFSLFRFIKYNQQILISESSMSGNADMDPNKLFQINLRIAEDMITLAMYLKMSDLQQHLIKFSIMPIINRENAVKYALYSLLHLKHLYLRLNTYNGDSNDNQDNEQT